MKLDIQTLDAKKSGSIDLDDEIFGISEIRADILQRMVKYQLAKRRAGTHKTQSRGEVSRSHSKLYKQKGTGQARHGAANAPIFRGGGHAHNRLPRDYSHELTKKFRIELLAFFERLRNQLVGGLTRALTQPNRDQNNGGEEPKKQERNEDVGAHLALLHSPELLPLLQHRCPCAGCWMHRLQAPSRTGLLALLS